MHSIQALREQRAAKAKSLHELVNKEGQWSEDDQAKYDLTMQEIDALDGQISRINNANRLLAEEAVNDSVATGLERIARNEQSKAAAVYAKWLRAGDRALNEEDWAVIRNTMSTTTPGEGGYTVATDVARSVVDALKAYGGMRQVAEVIQTEQGNPMNFPTSDGTSEEGEIVAENAEATDEDPSFGTKALNVFKYSSKVIAVPIELLQDSSVDIEAFVRNRIVTRIGRITNKHYTIGTGSGQPHGVVTASAVGKVGETGQTATVTYDDLVDLEHSVDPAYRENPRCGFMMHDSSLRTIRKIKDDMGRPIFVPGYENGAVGGAPATIMGRPLTINQHVAPMAANAKSILFGDFSHYKIRDALEVQMHRFTDSAYAKKGQVGFLAFVRSGGNLVDVGGAVKHYANSAT